MRAYTLIPLMLMLSSCSLIKDITDRPETPVLPAAEQFVGMNERDHREELREFMGIDPARIEWCAAFVNSVLDSAGYPSTDSLVARSYLEWGVPTVTPQPGDIMVFRRGNQAWQGHVGFYVDTVEFEGQEFFVVLGGNQDQSVSYKLFPVTSPKLLDIRTAVLPEPEPTTTVTLSTKNWRQPNVPLLFDE